MGQLCTGADFWLTVASSLLRILLGFLLGVLFGTALAGLCWRFRLIDALARPLLGVLKSTPVASFIILALVWSFGGTQDPARRRLARAYLIRALVVAGLVILFVAVAAMVFTAALHSQLAYYYYR